MYDDNDNYVDKYDNDDCDSSRGVMYCSLINHIIYGCHTYNLYISFRGLTRQSFAHNQKLTYRYLIVITLFNLM